MKKKNKKVNAAIIIIGNEILSGRTLDINTQFLSKWLNNLGVEVAEVRTIADKEQLIVKCVNELRSKYKYVFTSGGIGPTHDDITSKAIAKAFKVKYDYNKEAYTILKNYYSPGEFSEGRKKMARMPNKTSLIYNPSSGAPGFIIENVYCLPGVPSILQSMVGSLNNKIIGGKKILSETISLKTVESEIAKSLESIQKKFNDVEIGSYPFFRQGNIGVSIVLRSTENKQIKKCIEQIKIFVENRKIKIIKTH